jgi:hypothetical protein
VIARSPRNIFRDSLSDEFPGGKALDGLGGQKTYQTQPNSECQVNAPGESDGGG